MFRYEIVFWYASCFATGEWTTEKKSESQAGNSIVTVWHIVLCQTAKSSEKMPFRWEPRNEEFLYVEEKCPRQFSGMLEINLCTYFV